MTRLGVALLLLIGAASVGLTHAVADAPAVDPDTATLEGSLGAWTPWYNTTISRSTEAAHSGRYGLTVRPTTSPWGVITNNWPGFRATTGTVKVSFWARSSSREPGGASLAIIWRDATGNQSRVDSLPMLSVPSVWTQKTTVVEVPAGTSYAQLALLNSSPGGTSALYFDDFTFEQIANLIDRPTATFEGSEGSVGAWSPWYGIASMGLSTAEARSSRFSLRVDVGRPGPENWGVISNNWPGFGAGPGPKFISFSGLAAFDSGAAATMRVVWRDVHGSALKTDAISLALASAEWRTAAAEVMAPPLTASFTVELLSGSSTNRGTLYFDDFVVAETSPR